MRRRPLALVVLGSVLYDLFLALSVLLYGTAYVASAAWWPPERRHRIAQAWARANLRALKWLCGLDVRITGLEHLPAGGAILFAKHQSTFDILVLLDRLGPTAWVAKKELLAIPVFGWAFRRTRPIAIDRSAGRAAVEQLVEQGRAALEEGRCVLIFPEGTRKAPGAPPDYRIGGAVLAAATGRPVVPIALNAGEFWPRGSLLKWPGTVDVVIGPPIDSRGRSAEAIRAAARDWIEAEMRRISDPARWERFDLLPRRLKARR